MDFAIIETGGKQYKVGKGETLKIERLSGKKEGDKVVFDKVLLRDNGKDTEIGSPYISGATVSALIKKEGKGEKVEVMKYKAKSRYLKTRGHRQPFFKVEVTALK